MFLIFLFEIFLFEKQILLTSDFHKKKQDDGFKSITLFDCSIFLMMMPAASTSRFRTALQDF